MATFTHGLGKMGLPWLIASVVRVRDKSVYVVFTLDISDGQKLTLKKLTFSQTTFFS